MINEITTRQEQKIKVTENSVLEYFVNNNLSNKFNDQQKKQFINTCILLNLNPIFKEIYAVPFYNKDAGIHDLVIIISSHIYVRRAQETGMLDGFFTEIINKNGVQYAKVTIKRKDWKMLYQKELPVSELKKTNNFWKNMPELMAQKAIISLGMREAFPDFDSINSLPYSDAENWAEEREINTKPVQNIKKSEISPVEREHRTLREGIKKFVEENNFTKEDVEWVLQTWLDKTNTKECTVEELKKIPSMLFFKRAVNEFEIKRNDKFIELINQFGAMSEWNQQAREEIYEILYNQENPEEVE